ncbi:hypothetical protein AABB24_008075 [Solanum stoloniferum]|uniref:Uncharacterized protein n=1 Tax=Solanum stoloniferum TaxID=62892 RepID=A0ABD2UUZ8_9SOLN
MEISWVFIVFGSWLLALAFVLKIFSHPKRKLPPGPMPWPIIGNLNLLGSLPHVSFHHLSQKYGDLMLLKFGSKPVLVASSPEMAKEILKTHDTIFASRPPLAAGKPILLKDHLPRFTLRTISRIAMSDKYCSDQSNSDTSIATLERLQWMLDEWLVLGGVINLGDWIPLFSWFDLQGYVRQMKALGKNFTQFYKYVIDDHNATKMQTTGDFVPKDMVDALLHLSNDPNLEVKLTSDHMMGLINVSSLIFDSSR